MSQKSKKKSLLKIVAVLAIVFCVSVVVLWFALPGILKDYVESNDKEWINREVTIGKIRINPLQLKASVYNASIKEPNGKSNFLSFDKLLVNFDLWDLIKKKISTDEITLTNLQGNIIQNGTHFNFSDLTKSSPDADEDDTEPLDFNLRNINIINAKLHYIDTQIDSDVVLDSITIKDEGFAKYDSIFDANVVIHQPEGGWLKGDVAYNLDTDDYKVDSDFKEWQISPFKGYVTSVMQLSEFSGLLNADLHLAGNVATDYIKSNGLVTVNDFKMIDPEEKPLMSFGELLVGVKQIDSNQNIYDFENILVKDSNVSFEYLPNGDNFTKWLVDYGATSEANHSTDHYVSPFEMLSIYIYDMTKEYIFKSYTADKIELSNFNLKFYDYTLEDPFHMDLEHLNIEAHDIKPENQFANFNVKGEINATGKIEGGVSVSRSGVENMKVDMNIDGLFLNRFSPYGRYYTAHRFMEGISSFENHSVIKDSYLTSSNKIHIENIQVSKKDKTRSGYSLPMRLAVALMKNSEGNIDLEIPIEGPVNDPEYKFGKVVWQIIKNIFTKAVSSPVKALSKAFKTDVDDLQHIYFDNGQPGVGPKQKKSLDKIAKVLNAKKELKVTMNHLYNPDYEMDAIALKSAKMEYLKQADLDLDKNIPLGKHAFDLSSTDPKFLEFLKAKTTNFDETISIPENARRLVGKELVSTELSKVSERQKSSAREYLINQGIEESRIVINDRSSSPEAINQSLPKFEIDFGVVE